MHPNIPSGTLHVQYTLISKSFVIYGTQEHLFTHLKIKMTFTKSLSTTCAQSIKTLFFAAINMVSTTILHMCDFNIKHLINL